MPADSASASSNTGIHPPQVSGSQASLSGAITREQQSPVFSDGKHKHNHDHLDRFDA